MSSEDGIIGFMIGIMVVVFFIGAPLLAIWALNTLFSFNIAYNISTWFAMFLIFALFFARPVAKAASRDD